VKGDRRFVIRPYGGERIDPGVAAGEAEGGDDLLDVEQVDLRVDVWRSSLGR
jgi:hypothetical protein